MSVRPENVAKVFAALKQLPDQAVFELSPGEVDQYRVWERDRKEMGLESFGRLSKNYWTEGRWHFTKGRGRRD
jgi:hypothetical protein